MQNKVKSGGKFKLTERNLKKEGRIRFWRRVATAIGFAAFLLTATPERVAATNDFPVFSTGAFDAAQNGALNGVGSDFNDSNGNAADSKRSARTSERVLFTKLGSNAEKTAQSRVKTPILTSKNAPEGDVSANEDGVAATSKTSFVGSFVSTVGALALTLGLFFAGVYLLKRLTPNRTAGASGALEIVETSPIGGNFQLLTIRWGKKLILVARSPNGVEPLSETSDPAEIAEILNAARLKGDGNGAFGRTNWTAALKAGISAKTTKTILIALASTGAFFVDVETRAAAFQQTQIEARTAPGGVSSESVSAVEPPSDRNKMEKSGKNSASESGETEPNVGSASLGVDAGGLDWIGSTETETEVGGDLTSGAKNNGENIDAAASDFAPNSLANGPSALFEPNGWLGPSGISASLKTALTLSILTLAPAILLMTTSFVRLSVVLAFLRQALGAGQVPSQQTTTALAIFLTLLIMAPVWTDVYNDAVAPYSNGEIDAAAAFERGQAPIRTFLARQIEKTGNTDAIWLFMRYIPDAETPKYFEDVPWRALAPAFLLSELKTAFLIGFQIFIPFLIIDLVVSSVLVSTGMMMLPPAVVSLPLKLALFVLTDGWTLVVKSLLESFAWSAGG